LQVFINGKPRHVNGVSDDALVGSSGDHRSANDDRRDRTRTSATTANGVTRPHTAERIGRVVYT